MDEKRHDEQLAQSALRKEAAGQRPTREETRALARVRKRLDEESRRQHYATVPTNWWRQWSGRHWKVLKEQAARWGLPVEGKTIDLAAMAKWVHDFLAEHGQRLATLKEPARSPLELKRHEDFLIRRAERLKLEGRLVDRQAARECLQRFAAHIRTAGEILQRNHGPPALKILNDALTDAQTELDELFGDTLDAADDRDS